MTKCLKNREEQEARNDPTGMIMIAMAAAAKQEADNKIMTRTAKIKSYLEYGYSRQDISQMLGIHPYIVDTEASRIEREDSEKDPIFVGWKRKSDGYVCIANGLPTRR